MASERVAHPDDVGWWGMLFLILFGCRCRTWFRSTYGPRCSRCLKEVPGGE